jgi:hypothetical protein
MFNMLYTFEHLPTALSASMGVFLHALLLRFVSPTLSPLEIIYCIQQALDT